MTARIGKGSPGMASSRVSDRNVRTGLSADDIAEALVDNLRYLQAKLPEHATRNDWYMALAYTVRDRILERYINTVEAISGASSTAKVVAYFSAEFLTGPHLGNALISLGIWQAAQEALSTVGQDLSNVLQQEEEPGLGNGGLGRLAACYMDSLATLIDLIDGGFFSNGDRELFRPLVESLLTRDDYMLLADYQAYVDCQQKVTEAFNFPNDWTRMSILNSARVGRFSSDRSIREYCRDIWNVSPVTADAG